MNPWSEANASENNEFNSLNKVLDSDVAEQAESIKCFIEESSAASIDRVGHKFQDLLKLKQGYHTDIPAVMISELMKLHSLENASTQSLFSVMNKILQESNKWKNGDVSHGNISQPVASLLKKILQEIERRTSFKAANLKHQNNLFKAREQKYKSRLRVLETLAIGTAEENAIAMSWLQKIKIEKARIEENKKLEEEDVARLMKEKDESDAQILSLKKELEFSKMTYENHCLQVEKHAKEGKIELEKKLMDLECLLTDSRKKIMELEAFSESKSLRWKRKELGYKSFIDFQCESLQDLRVASESIKQEVRKTQRIYWEEVNHLGTELKGLIDAAENYHMVLAENRKLYNEVQDLKGNIRVYCRIRPFLPGQSGKHTTIEYIGDNGELVVANPLKQGKDNHRLFKFNKVFGPAATQEEVFLDTQPLIRSVLDGYNVCIFAYGQTGSGKTYTMSGPNISVKEDWGVNYRALNDLFQICQRRKGTITYEVGVQMVEIYNEQVRDLLTSDSSQKRLGIWSTAQPNGLAVPDASMYRVKSTTDVLELMNIGLMNRAVGATALNERSSRSHSVLTVHVHGTDLASDTILRGSLHLVDLAGSERVDRSEATGERLREAQHINKSLSALGDVIFALAQKSPHVPYRNSKLTQVLQSSLRGQAKTLMFVQLNPDTDSYSETISTLKFAERVSGVELGAARSNKEGRGIRELMEQVTCLKETIAKKDEEIGRLKLHKTSVNGEQCSMSSQRYRSSSPRRHSIGTPKQHHGLSRGKSSEFIEKAASDFDNSSEYSEKHSDACSQESVDHLRHHKEFLEQSRLTEVDGKPSFEIRLASANGGQNCTEDTEILGFGIADSEDRLSDISDSGLSMGTKTNGSKSSIMEYTIFPEAAKPLADKEKSNVPTKLLNPSERQLQSRLSRLSLAKSSSKLTSSSKRPTFGSSSSKRPVKRW